ncbi:hypothetical protein PAXRUDRAFT_827002 [Paxillus rubicundulus Ve08.2h10]|uniref:Uncharacterized protein n=1 Tax=Paxillus rubicundulus Ve08.2h10 TaxID=930991 RepID=A0A0D0DRC7_9AGAM|nr:hypothetical protein PAXRUDRAFT_827002 [Paxillus rubicundulus Ve08.2h10]
MVTSKASNDACPVAMGRLAWDGARRSVRQVEDRMGLCCIGYEIDRFCMGSKRDVFTIEKGGPFHAQSGGCSAIT